MSKNEGEQEAEAGLETRSRFTDAAAAVVATYLCAGVAFYSWAEGWSYVDALYFCITTLMTVGFGDLIPTHEVSRAFTIGYILTGMSLVATCLGILVSQLQSRVKRAASATGQTLLTQSPRARLAELARLVAGLAGILLLGTAVTVHTEGWGWLDALFFSLSTCASIGYGDFTASRATHGFMSAYMLVGVSGFALCAGRIANVFIELERDAHLRQFFERGVNDAMIKQIDQDRGTGGSVDRHEFMRYVLEKTGEVDAEVLDRVDALFDAFDADGSGVLASGDIRRANMERRFGSAATRAVPIVPGGHAGGAGLFSPHSPDRRGQTPLQQPLLKAYVPYGFTSPSPGGRHD